MNSSDQHLNYLLLEIAKTRNKLNFLSFDSTHYDLYEDLLHDLENELMEIYGNYLHSTLSLIYHQYRIKDQMMNPLAFIPWEFTITSGASELNVETRPEHSLAVSTSQFPDESIKLALLPSPVRFVVYLQKNRKGMVVWQA